MFQVTVTQIVLLVRFLLERSLRFRALGFCGHNLITYESTRQDSPLSCHWHFLKVRLGVKLVVVMVHAFVCDRDLAPAVRRRPTRRFEPQVCQRIASRFSSVDSGSHASRGVADVTEYTSRCSKA